MTTLRLRAKDLYSGLSVFGDTGGGKTQFLIQYLMEVERRAHVAVCWDPDRQLTRLFYNAKRGDWILDPSLETVPYWDISAEAKDEAEAIALWKCFFPDTPALNDPYWQHAATRLAAWLTSEQRLTTQRWGYLMAHDTEIDDMVKGTEFETILSNAAPGMRASVIAHLNLAAHALRMMPSAPDGRRTFTVRDWCSKRQGWIFLTSAPQYLEALKPIYSFFFGSLIQRTIALGPQLHLPDAHFVCEEAASININEFHTAPLRLRKTRCPFVFATQNDADLEAIHGKPRSTSIKSQPKTKIFCRTSDPESAQRLSAAAGKKRVRTCRETVTVSGGWFGKKQVSYTEQEEDRDVIDTATIMNLDDRKCFILQPGKAAAFELPVIELTERQFDLVERVIPPLDRNRAPKPTDTTDRAVIATVRVPVSVQSPTPRISLVKKKDTSLAAGTLGQAVNKYLKALEDNVDALAEQTSARGLTPDDFEGPPITRFVCSQCLAIEDITGAVSEPESGCQECGAPFASHNGEYIRNTCMQPHLKKTRKAQ